MLVASSRRGKLTALVALARRDTNRGAVAGISPGLSASETPGLGVAGGIIHIYRVAVAAKRPMDCGKTTNGLRQNDQRGCGKTTNGVAAKQPTGARRNDQRGRGETTNGGAAKQPTGVVAKRPTGAQYGWFLSMRMSCRNPYGVK